MCGIFGMTINDHGEGRYHDFEHDIKLLYRLSEVRGQDAAGLAVSSGREIRIFRRINKPSLFLKNPEFSRTLRSGFGGTAGAPDESAALYAIGHCRLVTNGSYAVHDNNQPVHAGHLIGVHNGIVLNAAQLTHDRLNFLQKKRDVTAESGLGDSDTQLFYSALDEQYSKSGSLEGAVSDVFRSIDGSASIAFLCDAEHKLIVATNTGSLYYIFDQIRRIFAFASEKRILNDFCLKSKLYRDFSSEEIVQLKPGRGLTLEDASCKEFRFDEQVKVKGNKESIETRDIKVYDVISDLAEIRRCRRCILPASYPFIHFDEQGVCNFCKRHQNQKFYGKEELEKFLDKYRSPTGALDCLVGISGGRDSSYGLHILKNDFGMHPIAYTYDWGLTTDTSRRNQAKVCGRLGIEHIIRAPDIQKKRRYIRKNIYAWLKNPQLGMVPLFMAGDKDFYHYGRALRKELNLKLTIFCSGYLLEQREFFVGFCGVDEHVTATARCYGYNRAAKIKLAMYYIGQYLRNPAYINESFFDSVRSYMTTFLQKDDFLYLYEYLPWNEKKIEALLEKEYNWEADKAYGQNQWRMGDGQTAFTNYIFYTVAGFSEFDNFRSNQVREGLITRDEALKLARQDNEVRFETLQYFSYVVGFNLDEILAKINQIPKLY